MKRLFAISLFIVICLISSSCSYSVNFVVINNSDFVLEVEYVALPDAGATPSKMNLTSWNQWFKKKEWQDVSQNEYQFDAETGRYKIKVVPNEVLRIITSNDIIYFVENYEHFGITNLQLTGKNGKVVYQGSQLFKQFEEKDYTNRFIIYK